MIGLGPVLEIKNIIMKAKFLFFVTIIFSFLVIAISCTNKDKLPETAKSGTYIVEKIIQTTTNEDNSRGIEPNNTFFDEKYDPDYIYLNIIGSENALYIPLVTINCETNKECQCFRYKIKVFDDGHAEVTSLDKDGNPFSGPVEIPSGAECYFSSHQGNTWELAENQIFPNKDKVFLATKHTLYKKDEDYANKEIYRSENNYSIPELTENIEELYMLRGCAGFTVIGLLYDSKDLEESNGVFSYLEPDRFITYMGSPYTQWYIKIYLGGKSFPSKYDLGTMDKIDNDNNYGYYSTGTFSDTKKNNLFVQFKPTYYGSPRFMHQGYGYFSSKTTRLLTPVLSQDLGIYVLIKKWEGTGSPSEEWLASDENALFTKVDVDGFTAPENNDFYIMGLLMDIELFSEVWKKKNESSANNPSPASRTTNGMHYFELKDAKVIVEKH